MPNFAEVMDSDAVTVKTYMDTFATITEIELTALSPQKVLIIVIGTV